MKQMRQGRSHQRPLREVDERQLTRHHTQNNAVGCGDHVGAASKHRKEERKNSGRTDGENLYHSNTVGRRQPDRELLSHMNCCKRRRHSTSDSSAEYYVDTYSMDSHELHCRDMHLDNNNPDGIDPGRKLEDSTNYTCRDFQFQRLSLLSQMPPSEALEVLVAEEPQLLKLFGRCKAVDCELIECLVKVLHVVCLSETNDRCSKYFERLLMTLHECNFIGGPLCEYIQSRNDINETFIREVAFVSEIVLYMLPASAKRDEVLDNLMVWKDRALRSVLPEGPSVHDVERMNGTDLRHGTTDERCEVQSPTENVTPVDCPDSLLLWVNRLPDIPPCVRTLPCGHSAAEAKHGLCTALVDKNLPYCNHRQTMMCHVAPETVECKLPCERLLPGCGHKCQGQCRELCTSRQCSQLVNRAWPCGHTLTVPCYVNPITTPCTLTIMKVLPCGHSAASLCWMDISQYQCNEQVLYKLCENDSHKRQTVCCRLKECLQKTCNTTVNMMCSRQHSSMVKCCEVDNYICPAACGEPLPCGHVCTGTCGLCTTNAKHAPCIAECRQVLPCQHKCQARCSEACPPCMDLCVMHCGHKQCTQQCGSVCDQCQLPCLWRCKHQVCQLACHEPCTRPPCDQPCPDVLDCGHPCMGLCGEPCPPVCFICKTEDTRPVDGSRFICLMPCCHVVSVGEMDNWVTQSTSQLQLLFKPQPVTCPTCSKIVTRCPRYNKQIRTFVVDANNMKKASAEHIRLISTVDNAVKSFWPDNNTEQMLQQLFDETVSVKDRELNSVIVGAICVWQECWAVGRNHEVNPFVFHRPSPELENMKSVLFTAINQRDYTGIIKVIASLHMTFLQLHIQRLLRVVTDSKQRALLSRLSSSEVGREGVRVLPWLEYINEELRNNFSLEERENIEHFLEHLNIYFQLNLKQQMDSKQWFLCQKGHVFSLTTNQDVLECSKCKVENGHTTFNILDRIQSVLVRSVN